MVEKERVNCQLIDWDFERQRWWRSTGYCCAQYLQEATAAFHFISDFDSLSLGCIGLCWTKSHPWALLYSQLEHFFLLHHEATNAVSPRHRRRPFLLSSAVLAAQIGRLASSDDGTRHHSMPILSLFFIIDTLFDAAFVVKTEVRCTFFFIGNWSSRFISSLKSVHLQCCYLTWRLIAQCTHAHMCRAFNYSHTLCSPGRPVSHC